MPFARRRPAPAGGRAAKPVPKGRERSGPREHATGAAGGAKNHGIKASFWLRRLLSAVFRCQRIGKTDLAGFQTPGSYAAGIELVERNVPSALGNEADFDGQLTGGVLDSNNLPPSIIFDEVQRKVAS